MTKNEKESLSMQEFTPAMQELTEMATAAKTVTAKSDLALVHDTRIGLRDARINIAKKGKELRENAIKFQKDVIQREKELLGIIGPEEDRLAAIEDEAKLRLEMEKRRDELPTRIAALQAINPAFSADDNELLAMDDDEFNQYRVLVIEAKLERDRQEQNEKIAAEAEARRMKAEAEEQEARQKIETIEREHRAKIASEESKIAVERALVDKEKARLAGIEEERMREIRAKEQEARIEKERAETEIARVKKETEEREKAEDYIGFLNSINFNEETDITQVVDGEVRAYRLIGTYQPNK